MRLVPNLRKGLIRTGDALLICDVLQPLRHRLHRNRLEPKLGTARGDRRDDARDVVADDAEACDLRVGLHSPT